MKIWIICLFLCVLGTSFSASLFPQRANVWPKPLTNYFGDSLSSQLDLGDSTTDRESNEEENIATLQEIFNAMAQLETEKAKMLDEKTAKTQLVGTIVKLLGKAATGLWKLGKSFLRKKYCSREEQKMRAMLQELLSEQGMTAEEDGENIGDGDSKAIAELQTVFNALKKADGKMMGVGGRIRGWFKKVKRWASNKLRKVTRKYLC